MMRWFFLMALILIAIPMPIFAADGASAQSILSVGDVLRGKFTDERHIQGFNGPMRSEGHFTVAPGAGLIWATEKPFPITSIITPSGIVQRAGDAEVMKIPATQTPFLTHLYDMLAGVLAGHWELLEKDFNVTRSGTRGAWQVDLTPHEKDNPGMPFNAITIKGGKYVETALMLKPDGDSDTITFLDQAVSPAPPNADEAKAFQSVGP